jgi:multiple sugar transport system ATP-binding protein
MRGELKGLFRTVNAPVLYVTHDQSEAMSLADEVMVMNEGRVVQTASPYELYRQPGDLFVATFVGSPRMNVWRARVQDGSLDGEGVHAEAPPGTEEGREIAVGIRPEDVEVAQTRNPGTWPAEVRLVEPIGGRELVTLHVGRLEFRALTAPLGGAGWVWVRWPAGKLHWFEGDSGRRFQPPAAWDTLAGGGLLLQG